MRGQLSRSFPHLSSREKSSLSVRLDFAGIHTGDVEPYIALSLALVAQGHRVRLATHGEFKELVESSSKGKVEFYDLGGDPR